MKSLAEKFFYGDGFSSNPPRPLKNFLSAAGVILIITGTIWFLQGTNVLPGSFMTGQTKWAVIGATFCVLGIGSLAASRWV